MTRPKSRGDRWEQVLAGAAKCFRRKGYEGTSIQDVADSVDMLKGSLYYYITSKEDLLYELLKIVHNVAIELIDEANSLTEVDPRKKLEWLIRRQIARNLEMLTLASLFYTEARHLSSDRRHEIYRTRGAFEALFCELVEAAQATEQVRNDAPAMLLTQICLATLNSLQLWYDPERSEFEPAATANAYADMLIHGLFLPSPRPRTSGPRYRADAGIEPLSIPTTDMASVGASPAPVEATAHPRCHDAPGQSAAARSLS